MITSLWKEIPFRYPKLLRFFEEISTIPRESHHEEQIADYLVAFALERRLLCYRDEFQNVLIEKAGSTGYEDHPPLLLQGHTDMVCEKNADVIHDFSCDPLDLYVEDGWIRARGTTLGADDGVAVAMMLAILDDNALAHPPIQCLFTSAEEVGMGGMENFDFSRITARRMINLDSPDELQIIAGCAGGLYSSMTLSAKTVPMQGTPLRVTVRGLAGGHSGEDIHRERANAIRILARLLLSVSQKTPLALITYNGGNKDNAIPREAEAVIAVKDRLAAEHAIAACEALIRNELSADDADMSVYVSENEKTYDRMLSPTDTERTLYTLLHVPCGVLARNCTLGNAVDLSCNLGLVTTQYDGVNATVTLRLLSRSSTEDHLDTMTADLSLMGRTMGADVKHDLRYSGWQYEPKSAIREAFITSAEAVCHQTPTVTVIHAGLECGTVKQNIPDMDIISCGPQVKNLHSPDEALNLASFEQFFAIMEHMLKSL